MAVSTPKSSSSLSLSSHLFPFPPSLSSPLQPKKSLHFRRHPSFSSSSSSTSSSSKPRRVSPAPLPQSPAPNLNFDSEISRLRTLLSRLRNANSLRGKLMVLNTDSTVRDFFASTRGLPVLDVKDEYLVKCLVAAGQGHVLGLEMRRVQGHGGLKEALLVVADAVARWGGDGGVDEGVGGGGMRGEFEKLLGILNDVEEFYDCVGGIIG